MIKKEFASFVIVGILNTLFGYALYWLLLLVLSYKAAYTLAYIAGIVLSYALNSKWVFKTVMSWKSFLSFPLVYLVQYVINISCLHVLVEKLGMAETWAPFAVIVVSVPVTFLLSRYVMKVQPRKVSS